MATGNQWKRLEFTLALSKHLFSLLNLKTFHKHFSQNIGYSGPENIRRIDIFVHVTCCPVTMPMSRIVKKTVFCFQSKAVYRAEDRPAVIRLKMYFTR